MSPLACDLKISQPMLTSGMTAESDLFAETLWTEIYLCTTPSMIADSP